MHTHIWDMPEKERIKAENQKGNKQQTREKCSMNAHSHILRRHGRKKNWTKTELNATELHWIELMLCSLCLRCGWLINASQHTIATRPYSLPFIQTFLICTKYQNIGAFCGICAMNSSYYDYWLYSIENEPFSRDNCIFSWNKLWEKKKCFWFRW